MVTDDLPVEEAETALVDEKVDPLVVGIGDFCLVETKSNPGTLFLAQVTEKIKHLITLHLWVINGQKKITPSYVNDKDVEWWRKNKKVQKPPPGYSCYLIDTRKWNIISTAKTFTSSMHDHLSHATRTKFAVYDD